ncbi:sugar O-acyltransferase, sialic acid O-acetyltransferase NeuD family [Algoriella xinjiangensis]|uniref:Sugar O-acyltransferase, sialic acid O-acetyltransferase NeuD family n=1 Tax=Algoriella xinjiangensis TaxID=684065 RepID=A0A1I4VEK7_9FLAO|nr:hypothetical protein [Algoriella xinjiangensis]SFM99611.1 sugar O-acyltransferase, sialic acid O-acetyltransferase NeuD family [Algoriella xinjiangensis]
MKRIAIIGSGLLSQQYVHHIHTDTDDKVIGYYDDFKQKGEIINDLQILGKITDILNDFKKNIFDVILIGVGYQHTNFASKLYDELHIDIPFYTFIHSTCIVDKTAIIKAGVVIYPGCIIDQQVIIEENVTINPGVMVGHNTVIGKHSFVAGSAAFAGYVTIGEKCFIGLNVTFVDNIKLSEEVNLAAGAVAIKNLLEPGWYVGNPAKLLKKEL